MVRFIAPEAIGCPPDPPRVSLDWLLGLCLHASLCVMLARLLPAPAPHADQMFWLGVILLFFPISVRIAAPQVARSERIWLLFALAEATFALKALTDPSGFVLFDEFLHWRSADDILSTHPLFVPNDLLFVAPFYPGLELVTTALIHLTGLTVFAAGTVVIAVCRAVFITVLFTFFERITGSDRLAGIGSLAYMGSTVYVMFDAQFAYESPGIALIAVILMMEAETAARGTTLPRTMALILPLLAALAMTHHVTNCFTVAVLCVLAVMVLTHHRPRGALRVGCVAASAVATALAWLTFIANPTSGPWSRGNTAVRPHNGGRWTASRVIPRRRRQERGAVAPGETVLKNVALPEGRKAEAMLLRAGPNNTVEVLRKVSASLPRITTVSEKD